MAKRVANKQLTMDNFDQDDEDDYAEADAGPQMASPEVIGKRTIARAKRRNELNAVTDETKKAFTGFSGFKGFGSTPLQNHMHMPSLPAFKTLTSTETKDNTFATSTPVLSTQTNGSKDDNRKTETATDEDAEEVYEKKLSQLNKSFFKHINGYMSRSEYYDFTQVCKEYIDYHKKIESESNVNKNSAATVESAQTSQTSDYQTGKSSWSSQATYGSQSTDAPKSSLFSSQSSAGLFSSQNSSVSDSPFFAKPSLQFNIKPVANTSGLAGPTATSTGAEEQTEEANEEESDEPPKVESVEHKESDAVFTKKCKLFFKKGDEWSNKGVGYLFIKKESPTSTPQLLIRADNKLGTILLHISLNESIPVSKAPQNKGVMVACVPNPPLDPKAKSQETVTFLIRVKPDDTEDLFDNLIKFKANQ